MDYLVYTSFSFKGVSLKCTIRRSGLCDTEMVIAIPQINVLELVLYLTQNLATEVPTSMDIDFISSAWLKILETESDTTNSTGKTLHSIRGG